MIKHVVLAAVIFVSLAPLGSQAFSQRLSEPLKDAFNRAARRADPPPPPPKIEPKPRPTPEFTRGPDIGGPRGPGGLSISTVAPNDPVLPPRLVPVDPPPSPKPPAGPGLTNTFNKAATPR